MKKLVDLHTHTIASGHAYNTLMEMANEAAKKGLEMYGITEHAPMMPGSCGEIYFMNYGVVDRKLFPMELLLGAEVNIIGFDGKLDLRPSVLKRQDVTIASLHVPCIGGGSKEDYTAALVNVMKNPLINIIGHPDDSRYPVDFDVITTVAKETNTLLELNNASLSPNSARQGARENDLVLLDYCKKKGVPILMGSDAHFFTQICGHANAEALLKEVDFPEELIMNYFPDKLRKYLNKYILAD